ncbi:hypothetical protein BOTBODRAFT_174474 [Botryobasidium botryosum FD-172 SS1]|uniref:Uncharacterized protein n=1 Tax=Botryobasidium botryosum (strain FD-172 SS1) TaxID=930990 RepID=A0A067MGP2_BOTB1|nr:hypothetical protein BOTBODRAFT_174474 [Botryobasidium botryosum FD-172 SS1]
MYYTNAYPRWDTVPEVELGRDSRTPPVGPITSKLNGGAGASEGPSKLDYGAIPSGGHDTTPSRGGVYGTIFAPDPHPFVPPPSNYPSTEPGPLPGGTFKRPPPNGFVLTDKIALFGLDDLLVDLYSHSNPPLPVGFPQGKVPIYQVAMLEKDTRVSSILPQSTGTKFEAVDLRDVTFTYQSAQFDRTKDVGLNLDAETTIDEAYGQLYGALSKFLKVPDLRLQVHCGFGGGQDWHHPLSISNFSLQGVFRDIQAEPVAGVKFTSIGARLVCSHATHAREDSTTPEDFGYSVFGSMHLTIPGSTLPLDLVYDIYEAKGATVLSAHLETSWKDAFGISAWTLQHVAFKAGLSFEESPSALTFDVSATMEARETSICFAGPYSTQGDFSLSASLPEPGFSGINNLYWHFFEGALLPPVLDIHIGPTTLTVSKDNGFAAVIHDLRIGGHTACDGPVDFSSNGASLRAPIKGDVLTLGEGLSDPIHISNAYVQVTFVREDQGTTTDVVFGGTLEWQGFNFDVGVHVYPAPDREKELAYTVYGKFKTAGGADLPLVALVPLLKGSVVQDVILHDAAIIIASRDNAELGVLSHSGYPIKKGIQVCGVLSELAPLSAMARDSHPTGLILSAGWTSSTGFALDIHPPSPITLNLGRGVTTDAIELGIVLGEQPYLQVRTGANIPVGKRAQPLHFTLDLTLGATAATATGRLTAGGGWINPFGICGKLTVGPDLAMSISLPYGSEPSDFGFVGGLAIGKVNASFAFQVDEVPSRQYLYAKVEGFDLHDLVEVVNAMGGQKLIKPPNDITFEQAEVYISPAGVKKGKLAYKPGFSFSSKMKILDIEIDTVANVGGGGTHCSGPVENLKIGRYIEIGGADAKFNLELNCVKQEGYINGTINIFGVSAKVLATLELHPKPSFELEFDLAFQDAFDFTVKGTPVIPYSESSCDITSGDFRLASEFGPKIRAHIAEKLNAMSAEKASQEADAARAAIEREHEARIGEEQKKLDEAHAAWQKKSDDTRAQHQLAIDTHKAELERLQANLDNEIAQSKSETAAAEARLSAAKAQEELDIREKENDLQVVRQRADKDIQSARERLDAATQAMNDRFGNAQQEIDAASSKVDSLNALKHSLEARIQACRDADWDDFSAKASLVGLGAELTAIEGAASMMEGILSAARGALESADFFACQNAIATASRAHDATRATYDRAISAAVSALETTITTRKELVQRETAALEGVRAAGEDSVKAASSALENYKHASKDSLLPTHDAVEALPRCTEWLAYRSSLDTLTAVKAAGPGALPAHHGRTDIDEQGQHTPLKRKDRAAPSCFSSVVIADVGLTLELTEGVRGLVFTADVKGEVDGDLFHFPPLEFDVQDSDKFIVSIFDQ